MKSTKGRHRALLRLVSDVQEFWISSDCRSALRDRLNQNVPASGWNVERCVLLGLGNIASVSDWTGEWNLLTLPLQVVVFLDLVKLSKCVSRSQQQ
jgi:hypothetical protein